MSNRLNPMPEPGEVVRVVAAEQTATRHRAHLVVQLRPANASAAVAEPHELDGVRVWGSRGGAAWIHRWPASFLVPDARRRDAGRDRWQYEARSDRSDGDGPRVGLRASLTPGDSSPWGTRLPVDAHRRTRSPRPGRGLVHDFIHQVIHTNRRSVERPCGTSVNRFRYARRVNPSPGRGDRIQRWSASSVEALEGVVGEQQAAVEVDPVGQRRHDRRSRRSRPTSPPCSRGRSGSRARGRARASAWPGRCRRTWRASR